MKKDIHPEYGVTIYRCACGNVVETRSTLRKDTQIDVCSACHPFYTGQQKLVDTAGRIDRFKKKFGSRIAVGKTKKKKPKAAPESEVETQPEASGEANEKTNEEVDKEKSQ